MRFRHVLPVAIGVLAGAAFRADGQTIVVPPTPFSSSGVQVSVASTALLDADSVFMCYRDSADDLNKFLVINIGSGAVELPPQSVPAVGLAPTCTVVASDAAAIAIRNDVSNAGSLFIVNPQTGAITHGPVVFGRSGTSYEYRLAAANASSVFIVWRSDEGAPGSKPFEGRFAIVDATTGVVRVPETAFDVEGINTVDVVALDANRVALAYQRAITGPIVPMPSFVEVREALSGSVVRGAIEIESNFGVPRILRVNGDEVLIAYRTDLHSRFVIVNTLTGATSEPTTYTAGLTWDFSVSPALVGGNAVLIPYWRPDSVPTPSFFVVDDFRGEELLAETLFTAASTHEISAVGSDRRVLLTYPEGVTGMGMFQVQDFSQIASPLACPEDVSDLVDIASLPSIPLLFPFLRLQFVFVRNRTADPIAGPLVFAVEELRRALLFTSAATSCRPPGLVPIVRFLPGADDVLAPGEVAAGLLVFLQTAAGDISYAPRLLAGIPPR